MVNFNNYFKGLNQFKINSYFELLKYIAYFRNFSNEEINVIYKAYHKALKLHNGVKRKNGDNFIVHPLCVAYILTVHGFDYETIAAALLHDTVEDTDYTLEEVREEFGDNIALLVDGVTKMKDADFSSREDSKIATHQKIFNSIGKDARIIAIKLSDRLHNMMTMEAMPHDKIIEKSIETREFYVPLSRTLGIFSIKDELQDLSLFYLDNDSYPVYYDVRENEIKRKNKQNFELLRQGINESLSKERIKASFDYKVKNIGGIYSDIVSGKEFSDINDLLGMRICLEREEDCYRTLEIISSLAKEVNNTCFDFIKEPKQNGYKSLNQNFIYRDSNIQVRIRTKDMQDGNYLGMVCNWTPETQVLLNEKFKELSSLDSKEKENPSEDMVKKAYSKFLRMKGK